MTVTNGGTEEGKGGSEGSSTLAAVGDYLVSRKTGPPVGGGGRSASGVSNGGSVVGSQRPSGIAGGGNGVWPTTTTMWTSSSATNAKKKAEPLSVSLRLRPQNRLEVAMRGRNCASVHKGRTSLTVESPLEGEYDFSFDRVYDESDSHSTVFEHSARPLASRFLGGYNAALIAYGQTGSGKTYTMKGGRRSGRTGAALEAQPIGKRQRGSNGGVGGGVGSLNDNEEHSKSSDGERKGAENEGSDSHSHSEGNNGEDKSEEEEGLVPRLVREIFRLIALSSQTMEYTVRCSYVEIYLEKVLDLLNPSNQHLCVRDDVAAAATMGQHGHRDAPGHGPAFCIDGATEVCALTAGNVLSLLQRGDAVRTAGSNEMCTNSSRSHAVFLLRVDQRDRGTGITRESQLLCADLAGSELLGRLGTKDQKSVSGGGGKGSGGWMTPSVNMMAGGSRGKVSLSSLGDRTGGGYGGEALVSGGGTGRLSTKEVRLANRSLNALAAVVKALSSSSRGVRGGKDETDDHGRNGGSEEDRSDAIAAAPFRRSKLTRILRAALGGDCVTSVVLTASPSSYSQSETLATVRFGQSCRRICNIPAARIDLSPAEYRRAIARCEKENGELTGFVRTVAEECHKIRDGGEVALLGPLCDSVHVILKGRDVGGMARVSTLPPISDTTLKQKRRFSLNEPRALLARTSEVEALRLELERARSDVEEMRNQAVRSDALREKSEIALLEAQSEVAVLRTQNGTLNADKSRNMQDLIDAKNEIQLLSQRKLEVEHNLRTSQFRENEATVFLRQFRRFYRRLLRNKAVQGTGDTGEVMAKVPGVPDLTDLIDVDTLLLESGLIEEDELHDDTTIATYRPSGAALLRSTSAAKKASKHALAMDRALDVEGGGNSASEMSEGSLLTSISSTGINRRPTTIINSGSAENLDTISEIGDRGVSEAYLDHKFGEGQVARARRGTGADDLASIGKRQPSSSIATSAAGGKVDAGGGADAGAGESETTGSFADTVSLQSILSRGSSRTGGLSAADVTHRQKVLRTPSGRLTTMREKDLEKDLIQMMERVIELQRALNDEKANVDVLTNRSGSLSKKRLAQEAIGLRQALDRKTHDLQAIIWKMNELHLMNKTYKEKMANREQHVTYLEEDLIDLQKINRRLVAECQENERRMMAEIEGLRELVDGMSVPLWQFGEEHKGRGGGTVHAEAERTLMMRMLLSIQGDEVAATQLDETQSSSEDEDSYDDLEGGETLESKASDQAGGGTGSIVLKIPPSVLNVSTQTDGPSTAGRGVMTEEGVSAGTGGSLWAAAATATGGNAAFRTGVVGTETTQQEVSTKPTSRSTKVGWRDDADTTADIGAASVPSVQDAHQLQREEPRQGSASAVAIPSPSLSPPPPDFFLGGHLASFSPRRHVRKLGPTIKPGVLKESKRSRNKPSRGGSSSVEGSVGSKLSHRSRIEGSVASKGSRRSRRSIVSTNSVRTDSNPRRKNVSQGGSVAP